MSCRRLSTFRVSSRAFSVNGRAFSFWTVISVSTSTISRAFLSAAAGVIGQGSMRGNFSPYSTSLGPFFAMSVVSLCALQFASDLLPELRRDELAQLAPGGDQLAAVVHGGQVLNDRRHSAPEHEDARDVARHAARLGDPVLDRLDRRHRLSEYLRDGGELRLLGKCAQRGADLRALRDRRLDLVFRYQLGHAPGYYARPRRSGRRTDRVVFEIDAADLLLVLLAVERQLHALDERAPLRVVEQIGGEVVGRPGGGERHRARARAVETRQPGASSELPHLLPAAQLLAVFLGADVVEDHDVGAAADALGDNAAGLDGRVRGVPGAVHERIVNQIGRA